jgi:hypothetical protein
MVKLTSGCTYVSAMRFRPGCASHIGEKALKFFLKEKLSQVQETE